MSIIPFGNVTPTGTSCASVQPSLRTSIAMCVRRRDGINPTSGAAINGSVTTPARAGSAHVTSLPNRTSPSSARISATGRTTRALNANAIRCPTSSRGASTTAGPSPSSRAQPTGAGTTTRTPCAGPSPSFVTSVRTRTVPGPSCSTNVPLAAP
ncbi:MAG: hypothetical protein JO036_14445 [Candidatus Eremiobacteraeota bacterium]|nr:hypothetical protein [Candidatus Eremiobacteraeota bacterium]